ncbi:uncharacterized protein LOC133460828 [Cololabis saira]|uniref:uncharacterized protein LOC133460828 n=1 Tax=Cololabis saira TaxID=129043 RepID=UPI002AD4621F|nr:uncharacterized protein LOC133460828 [Cololabis saira]
MPTSCCVYGCTNRNPEEHNFFAIPRGNRPFQKHRRSLWLQAKRTDWTEESSRMPAFAVLISYLVRCHWTTRVLILCPLFFHTLNKTKTLMQRSKGTKEKRNGVKDFWLLHKSTCSWSSRGITSMDHSPTEEDIPVTMTEYNDLNLRYTELKSDHVNLQEKYQQLRDENERLKEELKKSTFSYSNIKCNMLSPKANGNFLHRRSTHQDNCHV